MVVDLLAVFNYHMPKRGFTLIELLVVVAIIGILSTVVLAFLSGARNGAKEKAVITQMNNLRTAVEINSNGSYTGVCALATLAPAFAAVGRSAGLGVPSLCAAGDPEDGTVGNCGCSSDTNSWVMTINLPWETSVSPLCVSNATGPKRVNFGQFSPPC
jgi:prepilin-type N-terminal cleavage/methylation domain-containing protein